MFNEIYENLKILTERDIETHITCKPNFGLILNHQVTLDDMKDAINQYAEKGAGLYSKIGKTVGIDKLLRKQVGQATWENMTEEQRIKEFKAYANRDLNQAVSEMQGNPVEYLLDRALDIQDPMSGVYKLILKKMGASINSEGHIKLPKTMIDRMNQDRAEKKKSLENTINV